MNNNRISLKCKRCNGTLTVDEGKSILACPYCGAKELIIESDAVTIEKIKADTQKTIEHERLKSEENQQIREEEKEYRKNFTKSKFFKFLTTAATATLIISVLMFALDETLLGIIALLQAICFGASIVIALCLKQEKRFLHFFVAFIGILLVIPMLKACGHVDNSKKYEKINWDILVLGNKIPETSSKKIDIQYNNNESLNIDVYDTSKQDYYKYIQNCKEKGYTIQDDNYSTDTAYEAYNDDGYCVELWYNDSGKYMSVEVTTPTPISDLEWDKHSISAILPNPKSDKGLYKIENDEKTIVIVGNVSADNFIEYLNECIKSGFTVNSEKNDNNYSAYNQTGYNLNLSYNSGNKEMTISLNNPMEFSEITFPSTGVSTILPLPKSKSGSISSNYDWAFSVYIENMSESDYKAYVQECVDAGFVKDSSDYGDSYWADYEKDDDICINISYKGNDVVYIDISGSINKDYSSYKRKVN